MGLQQAHPGGRTDTPGPAVGDPAVHSTMRKTTDIQTIDGPRAVSAAASPRHRWYLYLWERGQESHC